jgi:hypothetical protein
MKSDAYAVTHERSADGTQDIYRARVHKCVPPEFSVIIGDAAHNLRSALDQLVCELIRANKRQLGNRSGFPIATTQKRFEEAVIGKTTGVSAKTERFIRRLKPYKGGNEALWILHELDAMDKHVDIVPVAAATVDMNVAIGMPFGLTPEGNIQMGQWQFSDFSPENFKPIFPLKDNVEIYRIDSGIHHQFRARFDVALGRTPVLKGGEPIGELLCQLANFVERVLGVAERRLV